jgi:hypothetical protein
MRLSFFSFALFVGSGIALDSSDSGSDFHLWEASEVPETLSQWARQYPTLVKVSNAQKEFGLPYVGTKRDCPYDGKHHGCLNHFFTIEDRSKSGPDLPDVLLTGSMHGEQLGLTVVMETAALLLEAASCEAKPSLQAKIWEDEVAEAISCRSSLRSQGIDDVHRQWLARLVATRRIVVVPNPNPMMSHLENNVDPTEDFPYNNVYSESCMRTVTARSLNELFRTHMFQIALLFKEGEDEINYSWGTQGYISPDNKAYKAVAGSLSYVVGGETMVPYSPSNTKSVSLTSDFQFNDWAYAASWENPRTTICNPLSYGGYDTQKTVYPVETNRALAFTVSSKTNNVASGRTLGNVSDVFHAKDNSNGLAVSRNMRLALVATDLVQPYVSIFGINSVAISEDVIPLSTQPGNLCDTSRIVAVPGALDTVIVEWTVGGAIDISQTDLWVARAEDIPDNSVCSMNLYDGFENVRNVFKKIPSRPNSGSGFFSTSGPNPLPKESVSKPFSLLASKDSVSSAKSNAMGGMSTTSDDSAATAKSREFHGSVNLLGPVFRTEIDLLGYEIGDRLVVIASATVDQDFGEAPDAYHQPLVNPQSHFANMRTNPDHEFEISGKKVQGRVQWLSIPVTVVVDEVDKHAGGIEMYMRLNESSGYLKPGPRPKAMFGSTKNGGPSPFLMAIVAIAIASVFFVVFGLGVFVIISSRRRRRQRHSSRRDGVVKDGKRKKKNAVNSDEIESADNPEFFTNHDEHIECTAEGSAVPGSRRISFTYDHENDDFESF